MTCSKNFGRLLQASCLGLIGMLTVVGCGGSSTTSHPDAYNAPGLDGGPAPDGQIQKANLTANPAQVGPVVVAVGATSTPLSVNVINNGNAAAAITVTTSAANITTTGCTASLTAGSTCALMITVSAPATATDGLSIGGTVTVAAAGANSIAIGVIATASVPSATTNFTVNPLSIPLGDVALGATAKASVTVTATAALTGLTFNVQGTDLKIDATATTCAGTLAANATCNVVATFSGTTVGAPSGDAIVVSQGGVFKTIPVSANVLAPAKLAATPTAASLPATAGTASAPLDINVGNIGGLPTGAIGVALSPATGGHFAITSDKCSIVTLIAGAACVVTVTYNPAATATTNETATLTITDKGTGASSAPVTLTGVTNPIQPPPGQAVLTLTGGPALGSVAPGASGDEVIYTVTNTSATPSGKLTKAVATDNGNITISSDTCAAKATLNQGDTCTIGLTLTPPKGAIAQSVAAVLTVSWGTTGILSASATGSVVTGAALSAAPPSVSFGSVFVNQSSAISSVTIKNTGATDTGTLFVTFSGTGAAQVAPAGANTCTGVLHAGGTCTIGVQYNATDITGVNGSISVTDGSVTLAIPMVGTGLLPTNLVVYPTTTFSGATAAKVDFKSMVLGGTTDATHLYVVVPSTSTTDSGTISAPITGDNASDFAVKNNCTVSLVPGAFCTLDVTFTPSGVGARAAVLTVSGAKGGTWPVQLTGTGQPIVGIYACATASAVTTTELAGPVSPEPEGTCANLSTDAADFDFAQVSLNGTDKVAKKFRVIVRGPTATVAPFPTNTLTVALNDPSTAASNFSYPGSLTRNPCDGAVLTVSGASSPTPVTAPGGGTWTYVSLGQDHGWVCDFDVQFFPQGTVKEQKTATLTAAGNPTNGGSDSKTLTGTATGPLTIKVDANSPSFPSAVTVGDSTNDDTHLTLVGSASVNPNLTLNVKNTSTTVTLGPLTVALAGDQFQIVQDFCSNAKLAPTTSCQLIVAFSPTGAIGAKTGTITVSGSGESQTYALSGNAGTNYLVTIAPAGTATAPVDLGTVVEGGASAWKMFTVNNPTGAPKTNQFTWSVNDAHFTIDGTGANVTGAANPCGASGTKQLDGGGSCNIWVQYQPLSSDPFVLDTAGKTVSTVAKLTVDVNNQTSSLYSVISGTPSSKITVTSAQATKTVTAITAYDFGDVAVGADVALTLTVANVSAGAITVQQQPVADPFSIVTGGTCAPISSQFTLAAAGSAGASCTVVVQMRGRAGLTSQDFPYQEPPTAATFKDVTTLASGTAQSSASAELTGRTVRPAGLQVVGLPTTHNAALVADVIADLGSIVNPNATAPVTFTFVNTGDVPAVNLHFAWNPITGVDSTCTASADNRTCDPFTVVAETGGCFGLASLAAQATCTISLKASPASSTSDGAKSIHFSLSADNGINVVTTFQLLTTVRRSDVPANEVYFDYHSPTATSPLQYGFLPFVAATTGRTALPGPSTQVSVLIENKTGSTKTLPVASTGVTLAQAWGALLTLPGTSTVTSEFTVVPAGSSACTGSLAPNSSCTIGVTFTPTVYTDTSVFEFATLTVLGNTLGLVGEITAPAQLKILKSATTLSTNPLDFGDVLINTTQTITATLTNVGQIDATAITLSNTNTTVFNVSGCTAGVPAGTSCTLTAVVTPTGVTNTGTLNIIYTGGNKGGTSATNNSPLQGTLTANGVISASLVISGTGVQAGSAADTQTFDFATVGTALVVGAATTQSEAFTITNNNSQASGALAIALAGNTDSYTLDLTTGAGLVSGCQGTIKSLASGASCVAIVTFKPVTHTGATVPGDVATSLSVKATPGTSTAGKTVAITGHSKSALDFASAATGGTVLTSPTAVVSTGNGTDIYVRLNTAGLATGPLSTAGLSGTNAASFYITQNTCLFNQLPGPATQDVDGASCIITVQFVGTATATTSATLSVSDGTTGYTNAITVQH